MPRGNDSQAALVDLRGDYGASSGNAEDLIAAARHSQSQVLRQASLLERDPDLTDKLHEENDLEAIGKKLNVTDGEVIDAAVRGPFVVAVVEVDSGRTYKTVGEADAFKLKVRGRRARALEETEADEAERDAHVERMQAVADAAAAEREAQEAARVAAEKAREAASKPAKPAKPAAADKDDGK